MAICQQRPSIMQAMIVSDAIARAGGEGFTARQVLDRLKELLAEQKRRS